jgi:hypothetical protein
LKTDTSEWVTKFFPAKAKLWQEGESAGRSGKPQAQDDPSYVLGYLKGEIAREEAENGEPWSSV